MEMRDLLGDNITLTRDFEALNSYLPAQALLASSRPHLREVTSLPSWIYCFLTYMAVRTSDQATRDRLVYSRLIVREALRHGGRGWLDYDRLFCQQAALDSSLPWNTLHASLLASTIIGHCPGAGTFCTICQGCDHLPAQCALACTQQPTRQEGVLHAASGGVPRPHPSICWSWNSGHCTYPGLCIRQHICATYESRHPKARDCRDTPADSHFKQPQRTHLWGPAPPASTSQ